MPSARVAILGAGFAGCATAWELARRGIDAIVLERERGLGRYASGRGAGLGRQLCEDDTTSELAMRGAAGLRTRFSAAWAPTGGVLCFDDPVLAADYIARAERLGLAHEVIDRASAVHAWPQLARLPIASALLVPSDGVIDAMPLLHAFAADLRIRYDTTATRLEPAGAHVRVHLRSVDGGTELIEVGVVVDATGAWAGQLVGDPPLESFKRHLFVVEAAAASDAPYLWYLGKDELYVRGDAGGVLVSPCDGDPTAAADQQPSPDADVRLRGRLTRAPELLRARIVRAWACQRAFAPDRMMRLGRDPRRPWLVWAAALGGHGATASPAVGEVVADAVLEALA